MQATLEDRPLFEIGYKRKKLVPDWLRKERGISEETHKFCPDCEDWQPREEFLEHKGKRDGLAAYCQTHTIRRNKIRTIKRRERRREKNGTLRSITPLLTDTDLDEGISKETHKYCHDCSFWVLREDFYSNKSTPDGLSGYCKVCSKRRRTGEKSVPDTGDDDLGKFERRHFRLMAVTSRPDHEVRAENERRFERMKSKDRTCSCCGEKLGRYTRGAYCLRHATDEGRAAYTRFVRDREMVECGQGVLAV